MTEQFELYESLFFEGFPVGYATEKIIAKQNNSNWDAIVVYKTPFVTDTEFNALQAYLDNGGTLILDNNNSLTKDEYGKQRKQVLLEGKGKLIVMQDDGLEALKAKSLEIISDNLHDVVLVENNGTEYKGCTWRVIKNPNGGYLMNILNLGKNSAKLQVGLKNNEELTITNLLTGEELSSTLELPSNGVLLLDIE